VGSVGTIPSLMGEPISSPKVSKRRKDEEKKEERRGESIKMATPMSPSEALAALARCCQQDSSSDDPATINDVVVCVVRLMEKGGR
jgi:hypothetical protein